MPEKTRQKTKVQSSQYDKWYSGVPKGNGTTTKTSGSISLLSSRNYKIFSLKASGLARCSHNQTNAKARRSTHTIGPIRVPISVSAFDPKSKLTDTSIAPINLKLKHIIITSGGIFWVNDLPTLRSGETSGLEHCQ